MLMAMLQNEELRQWLYYLTDDPAKEPKVSMKKVLDRNIELGRYSDEIQQDSKVILFIDNIEGTFNHNAPSTETWAINIAMPNEHWFVKQYSLIRPYYIASLIAETIDSQRLAGVGMITFESYAVSRINQRWTALTIFTKVVNSNTPESTIPSIGG